MVRTKRAKVLSILVTLSMLASMFVMPLAASAAVPASNVGVTYQAQVQRYGWMDSASNGEFAGTVGQALRMEAVKISLTGAPAGASIIYQTHVQSKGWMDAVSDGAIGGTVGLGKRVEAFRMTLSGLPGYEVQYEVQGQTYGWSQGWLTAANGTAIADAPVAGTTGQAKRIEAIRIKVVKTAAEVSAETAADAAVTKAEASKTQADIDAAKTAIASVQDTAAKDAFTARANAIVVTAVTSISAVSVTTSVGTAPSLPATATAYYNDGTTKTVNVTWDAIDASKYADGGSFTVSGKIAESSTVKASATVTVLKVVSIDAVSVSTVAGTAPVLPETVTAHISDGTTKTVNVTWDAINASKYATDGSFTVSGTIANSTVKATATVTVDTTAASMTPANDTIAINASTTFKIVDESGKTVTPANVVYSITSANAATGFFNNAGAFSASAAGTYTVQAAIGATKLTAKVTVYGAAASISLAASSNSIVANAASEIDITATVLDANGAPVLNYNGTATIATNGAAVFIAPAADQPSDFVFATSTLTITNGVGTFKVQAGATPGLTSAVTATGVGVNPPNAGRTSISSINQVATAISVTTAAPGIPVNTNGQTASFAVQVVDQNGKAMLGGTYPLTAALSGSAGSISANNIVITGFRGQQNLIVTGVQGATGYYTVTVSGTGLATGSASIPAVITGNVAKFAISNNSPSFTQGNAAGTTFTLSPVDASGYPSAFNATVANVFITKANGDAATNFRVNGIAAGGNNGYAIAIPAGGPVNLIVTDPALTADAGTYSIVVKDTAAAPLTQAASSFTENGTNVVARLSITSANTILLGTNAQTVVTLQSTDTFGNAVTNVPANTNVTLTANGNNHGSAKFGTGDYAAAPQVTIALDSTGKATTTFAAQDYDGAMWTITAATAFDIPRSVIVYVTDHPVASFSFSISDTAGAYQGSSVYLGAGDTLSISALVAKDVNGNVITPDNDPVTLVVYHASGLSGLAGGTANAANDTYTITGSFVGVNAVVAGLNLRGAIAGSVTITLTDDTTHATGSASIQAVAGAAVAAVRVPTLASATTLAKSAVTLVTIQLVDAGGNAVAASHETTINLTTAIAGASFQDTNRLPITSVTIAAGTSSASVYIAAGAAGNGTITFTDVTDGFVYVTGALNVQ